MNQQQWGQKKGLEDLTGRLITTSKPPTLSPKEYQKTWLGLRKKKFKNPEWTMEDAIKYLKDKMKIKEDSQQRPPIKGLKSGEAANGSPKTVAATVADNGIWETYMICKEVRKATGTKFSSNRELITLIAELEAIINEKPLADIEEIGLKLRLEDFLNPGSTRGGQLTEKSMAEYLEDPKKNEFIVHLVFKSIEEQNTTSALERYYYYESIDECLPFSYGSCIENGNGFDSMNDASDINSEKFLISEMNNIIPITITSIILTESDLSINTKVLNLDNSQENDNNDEENSIMIDNIRRFEPLFSLPELCLLPEDAGPCFGEILRWRYNSETNHCETFIYTGCNHNANYFTSEEACLRACEEYRNSGN
ncbi:hypothetical protein DINM_005785 [Dirofilaria immitis]|nr:hypothetical protein [Dirofilaria immitis]